MLYNFFKDKFVLFTSILSVILSALYVWKGFQLGFNTLSYIIIIANFLYMPLALLFGKKLFPIFYFIYSAIIIFGTAFDKTYLFNNYTGLFIVSIVVMLKPKLRKIALIFLFRCGFYCVLFERRKNLPLLYSYCAQFMVHWNCGICSE